MCKIGEALSKVNLPSVPRDTDGWVPSHREHLDTLERFSRVWCSANHREKSPLARLRLRVSGQEQERLTTPPTRDTEAYQLYLRGRYWSEHMNKEGFEKAAGYYMQALDKDPVYALPYAGLADAYYLLANMSLPPREAMERSRAAALRALDRDSLLSDAHLSLAIVKTAYEFDWLGAGMELQRAIELNLGPPRLTSSEEGISRGWDVSMRGLQN